MVSSTEGSETSTFWKRRARARSFSKIPRNSWNVVEPMQRISPDEDLFAHYSAITMDGYKTLKAGQAVSFETIEGPKGLHAVNIDTVNAVVHEKPATPAAKKEKKVVA